MSETPEEQGNETPEEHSKVVGGSTASRRIHCPASLALEAKVPDEPGSSYAQEGTALHEMLAKLLLDPDLSPDDLLPFTFHKESEGFTYTVTEDVWVNLGQPALDAFLDYCDELERETGAEMTYLIEVRAAFPGIANAFGTSDIVWRCGNISGIWDWKMGYKKVKAEDNDQLLYYFIAAANEHPKMLLEGVDLVELAIMQPQSSHEPDVWEVGGDISVVTQEFTDDLKAAITEARELGEEAHIEKGPWCEFASCKAICPLHINPAVRLGQKLAELKGAGVDPGAKKPDLSNAPTFKDDLPALLELADTVQDFASDLVELAHRLAEGDEEYRDTLREAGWLVVDKKPGARKFVVDDDDVLRLCRNRGMKIDDVMPRKLRTPKQIEDELKARGKKMPGDIAKTPPPSGTKLVRAETGATEHQDLTAHVAGLAERLAHRR